MTLPLNIDYIPDEIVKKAEKELGETPEIRKTSIEKMRDLMKSETDIFFTLSDNEILMFLRSRKFDADKAFICLKNCFKKKNSFKKIGGKFCLDIALKACQNDMLLLLPNRDEDGCNVIVFKICNYDTKKFKFVDLISAGSYMVATSLVLHPVTQICGSKLIVDCRGLSLDHFLSIRPKILQFTFQTMTNAFPGRFKGAHILCDSNVIPNVWRLTKPFLDKKLQNRVFVYGSDVTGLYNHFCTRVIPKDFDIDSVYDKEIHIDTLKKFWSTNTAKLFCASED